MTIGNLYRAYLCALILPVIVSGFAAERKPWDAIRFVQQSIKFVTVPFVSGNTSSRNVKKGDVLWKVEDNLRNSFTMAPLDDVVMGGASSSTFESKTGIWSGSVTDANNGGFIGIRSTPAFQWNIQSCRGLEWKIKSYQPSLTRVKFVLRDSTEFNGITWTTSVNVQPGMNSVRMLFDKQVPALFAKTIPDQTFRKENVCAVQVAYSKFEYDGKLNPKFELGDVRLQLLELRAI